MESEGGEVDGLYQKRVLSAWAGFQ
jgi:hypothetical protein